MNSKQINFHDIDPMALTQGLFGFEKEVLRVNPDGTLAVTPHPAALGNPLTHTHVTLDFSESQIELVTSPHPSVEESLAELDKLSRKTALALDKEYLWPFSMPCRLPELDKIPIAKFGDSPEGKKRELYRIGLAERYGKAMQMICAIHFNFSFGANLMEKLFELQDQEPEFRRWVNECYMGVVRNVIRNQWVLTYLFGASPELDRESYKCQKMHKENSKAISLRLSRCGYSNPKKIEVDYNSFDNYIGDLRRAVRTPYPEYEVYKGKQLNENVLQLANEYYFPIRLKSSKGETYLDGLEENGAEYLELRIFDVNPFTHAGLTKEQAYFCHLFFLNCLLTEQETISEQEVEKYIDLHADLALNGQELPDDLREKGEDLFEEIKKIADYLGGEYKQAYDLFWEHFEKAEGQPWALLLKDMKDRGEDFLEYGVKRAKQLHQELTT